jgi:hypothetical protein
MANHSYANARRHLDGVAAMLKAAGPESLISSLSRDIYFEYRALDVSDSPREMVTREVSCYSHGFIPTVKGSFRPCLPVSMCNAD